MPSFILETSNNMMFFVTFRPDPSRSYVFEYIMSLDVCYFRYLNYTHIIKNDLDQSSLVIS